MKSRFITSIQATVSEYFRLFIFLTVFIIVIVGWLILLAPKYSSIQQNAAIEYRQSTEELNRQEAYLGELKQLSENYGQLNHNALQRLGIILPTKGDIPGIFAQLEELAHTQGLSIRSIDSSQSAAIKEDATAGAANTAQAKAQRDQATLEKTVPGLKTIDVSFQIEGIKSYEQLLAFLRTTETSMRLFDIKALQYEPGQASYAFNMRTYYLEQ